MGDGNGPAGGTDVVGGIGCPKTSGGDATAVGDHHMIRVTCHPIKGREMR